ncbi:type II toxin-antitoxin system Phd/YefM family antitoxin [Candidatus Desulforudis audaxviator]|uniref:Antitoxin n=1 Tax=Desulforudis audaxviator (strain MP104C) TaxID=477974 RepID=B1I1K6_DESAP|nr:type II toxin-antitoxin system prevent-host-death family antitoxin [Candidatus Desulforudis audaxviator]ACA58766.1 prevent-host-death family protein [Candidatus Desulforudis audaxviator MP104C]AZK58776.1 RelB/StbD replicon stabilization protein (antitoxin to RelE/StbE) [Candidatus Desulforudis audaxviator]
MRIGIREMKTRFSRYIQRIKEGETIIITERNTPVAKLVPIQLPVSEEILRLVEVGMVSWKGGKPKGLATPVEPQGTVSVADIATEDRR